MLILAAGADDPEVGPGRLIALIIAALICYLYWRFDPKRDRGDDADDHSPTGPALPPAPRDAQVGRVSSHVSRRETPERDDEVHWWGSISRDARGIGRRVYGKARHIAATGDSPPDVEPVPDDEPVDDFPIDLDLDGAVPDDDEAEVEPAGMESREEYAARCLGLGIEKALIVKALQEHYGISRPTAYRVVAEAEPRRAA